SLRRSGFKDAGQAPGEVLQALRAVATALFGDAPAGVVDVVQGAHHGGPVVVAFEEFNVKALPEAMVVAELAAEFFDVELLDARAEDANPLFRPAEVDDVADVEVPADG